MQNSTSANMQKETKKCFCFCFLCVSVCMFECGLVGVIKAERRKRTSKTNYSYFFVLFFLASLIYLIENE